MRYLLFLFFTAVAFAQNPPANAAGTAGCVQVHSSTGSSISCGGSTVVASLPTASAHANAIYLVHDGTSSSDCTSGGGTSQSLCVSNGSAWVALGGAGGLGTVTSIILAGTTGQITVTGTCTVTTTGTCTFSLPANVVLPGTINSLTLTTSTGTITIANGETFTVNAGLTLAGTDGVTVTFPATNATVATLGLTNTFTGKQDASGAPHTLPAVVVATVGALPATGCSLGELAVVTGATLGQQLYENSGIGTCIWTQQLNSGTATGGGITMYSATSLTVTANTYYIPIGGGGAISTTETNVDIDSPTAATITNMFVQQSVAIGAGNTAVYTFRKNATSQSVTCTISGASATSCSDSVHSFNVSQGDLLTIQLVTTGTIVATPNILIAAQFGNITATGTVNTGITGQLGYYAGNGAAISGTNAIPTGTTATTPTCTTINGVLATTASLACVSGSLFQAVAVNAATVTVLPTTPSYSNGSSGVGATLTATGNGAFPAVDGYTASVGNRILVNNQADSKQNGVYSLTTLGNGGTPYVLTRATDFNTVAEINGSGAIPTLNGTVNNNVLWILSTTIAAIGTGQNNINYSVGSATPFPAYTITNAGSTGTVLNKLVKLTGAPSTAIQAATTDTTGIIGICLSNCSTSGAAIIGYTNTLACVFDGATTAGDYVQISATTAGDCHDGGATYPTSGGDILGRAMSTNGSGGTFQMIWGSLDVASKANPIPVNLPAPGTTCTFSGSSTFCVCTNTCTITVPVPAAGDQFCALNDDNVATVITLSAIGSSSRYENTARTAYGTAGTGTLVSGGAVKDSVCIIGRDSTHYLTTNFVGTWTAN